MSIAEMTTRHGYSWRYDHPADEPEETFDMARRVVATVAEDEVRKHGKSYVVAMTLEPRATHVFSCEDPQLAALAMEVLYEMTPQA